MTSKSKHTSGPWQHKWGGDVKYSPEAIVTNRAGLWTGITIIRTGEAYLPPAEHTAEREANARLVAAAPELLEAAMWILRSAGYENGEALPTLRELTVGIPELDRLRAAIAKIEKGEQS